MGQKPDSFAVLLSVMHCMWSELLCADVCGPRQLLLKSKAVFHMLHCLNGFYILYFSSCFLAMAITPVPPNTFFFDSIEDPFGVDAGSLAVSGVSQVMSPITDMEKTNAVTIMQRQQVDKSVPDHERARADPLQYGPDFPSGLPPA